MEKENIQNKIDNSTRLGKIVIIILVFSTAFLVFSFLAPYLFIQPSFLGISFNDSTGLIGDSLGGIMNPFIAISGILLTFLAFYIQYRANILQREIFKSDLTAQNDQFKKTQFENQFYEMVRLHKENTNEITIHTINFYRIKQEQDIWEEIIKGRQVFSFIKLEFELCYQIAKKYFPKSKPTAWVNEAYAIIFHGINKDLIDEHEFYKAVFDLRQIHKAGNFKGLPSYVLSKTQLDWPYELNYPIFTGYSSQLAHYYRHLFQTVKFIANDKMLTYEEKRNYLRILRAQLSNQEQVLLFYNWLSNFGFQWENETNKFLTDYRMIHNIYQDLLVEDVKITDLFNLDGDFMKEKGRTLDPLFEFQSWKQK